MVFLLHAASAAGETMQTATRAENVKAIREEIRKIKAVMKQRGIRRMSCFNGGHTNESYDFNARLFKLESYLRTG